MPGLIDSDTGLAFGESLVWMDPIGGGGLIIEATPALAMITEASIVMISEASVIMVTEGA